MRWRRRTPSRRDAAPAPGLRCPWRAASRCTTTALRESLAPFPQADTAAAALARRTFVDQFDAQPLERRNQLHQRLDVAADHPIARLHALDRGQRKTRGLGQLALVDTREGARGAQLPGGDHAIGFSCDMLSTIVDVPYII